MDIAWITAQQLWSMLLFMICGFVLSRKNLITEDGSTAIANLLIYLVIPVVIFRAFLTERSPEKSLGLLLSVVLAAACLVLAIILSRLLFPRKPIEEFGAEFSNAGFLGIPLISATIGAEYVFYAAGFVALLNILQWTYGQSRMGVHSGSLKKLFLSPLVISFPLGLLLYWIQPRFPAVLTDCVSAIASCNSPLAMILLGVYLGRLQDRTAFTTPAVWAASGVRLVLIPLATLALLTAIPVSASLRMTLFLVAAAPIGSNVAMYAQRAKLDYRRATGAVCLSTLLSVLTMPLLAALAATLWNYH